jgi:toxin ParE1/3/4
VIGSDQADGIYSRMLKRFPYTIFYVVEGNTVFVLAVAHQRREPGYWRLH